MDSKPTHFLPTWGNVPLAQIAEEFGTPTYVYSADILENQFNTLKQVLSVPHQIAYAVKANSHLAILNALKGWGASFDIVSAGELSRVQQLPGAPASVVFSGVGKTVAEIDAALAYSHMTIHIESLPELERVAARARAHNMTARIALRINPDILGETHPYISTGGKLHKFGIPYEEASSVLATLRSLPQLQLQGLACHLGSQLTDISIYETAAKMLFDLVDHHWQAPLESISLGGGMGVPDTTRPGIDIQAWGQRISACFKNRKEKLMIEPGRFLIAPAGILLTRIEYLKKTAHKNFAIIDAGMNDLIRPSLYHAFHDIVTILEKNISPDYYDIVGPVCESGDVLGQNRLLSIQAGDLLAILNAGAYGMSMASHYNSRPYACEVWAAQSKAYLIRARESVEALWKNENIPVY